MTSVWYLGTATERTITSGEWAAVGAPGPTKTWNAENGYSIPQYEFTLAQIWILDNEALFDTNAPDGPRPGSGIVEEEIPWRNRLVLRESLFDEDGKLLPELVPTMVYPVEEVVVAVMASLPNTDYAALLRNSLSGGAIP
jgi:hypothetical protein